MSLEVCIIPVTRAQDPDRHAQDSGCPFCLLGQRTPIAKVEETELRLWFAEIFGVTIWDVGKHINGIVGIAMRGAVLISVAVSC